MIKKSVGTQKGNQNKNKQSHKNQKQVVNPIYYAKALLIESWNFKNETNLIKYCN